MRTALVNEKIGKPEIMHSSSISYAPLHITSSPAPMRPSILWELASIKKSIKGGAWQSFSTLRGEHPFEYFQRDLINNAKNHNFSEILDPTFIPGPSLE